MATIDNLNLIQAGEKISGNGLQGSGQPDIVNRTMRQLTALMDIGGADIYSSKNAINLVDNNDFEASVITDDIVMIDLGGSGKYVKATPSEFTTIGVASLAADNTAPILGEADISNAIIHTLGERTFNTYTFTKGLFYYLSNTVPGLIVDANSTDRSPVVVGLATSTTKLYVRISYNVAQTDNSIAMAIALGG